MTQLTAARTEPVPAAAQKAAPPGLDSINLLESELTRLAAEVLTIHSGFQAQILQALRQERDLLDQGYLARLQESENLRRGLLTRAETLRAEIEFIHTLLTTLERETNASIDYPGVDLSWMLKKKGEVRVLRAYLDGLRFGFSPP